MKESWQNVGTKIRYLRKSYGLTLKQLARGSGLSANTISLVERSQVSPTVETLCKIAKALAVSPSSLFLEICHTGVNIRRAKDIACGADSSEQFVQMLTTSQENTEVVTKDRSRKIPSHLDKQHTILCICGSVEFELDDQNYHLYPGDSVDFSSGTFHRWHNSGFESGIVVLVIPPTSEKYSQTG